MSDLKLPRLLAAAKEFNIGQDTLVEFLAARGFHRDELKPTAKLTPEMYISLQKEFQSDKVAKAKSDMIDLPKGATGDAKKRKEDEEITFRKEEKKPAEKEAPVHVAEATPVQEPIAEPVAPVVETAPPVVEPVQQEEPTKLEAPEIEMPKIVGHIDLDSIDSSTRPKKPAKKTAEPQPVAEPTPQQIIEPEAAIPVEETQPQVAATAVTEHPAEVEEPGTPVVENIQAEKITGPKVVGVIDLSKIENRPKPTIDHDAAKRKRKRIPITGKEGDKKPAGPQQGPQQGGPRHALTKPGDRRPGAPQRGGARRHPRRTGCRP